MNEVRFGWVAKECVQDSEILSAYKDITRYYVLSQIARDGGTAYGYFVDVIKDNFPVTLQQCDRVATNLCSKLDL